MDSDTTDENVLATKMIRCLKVYPRLSPSMLHTGIGPAIPSSMWRPVLELLIARHIVKQEQSVAIGGRTYTILSLTDPQIEPA